MDQGSNVGVGRGPAEPSLSYSVPLAHCECSASQQDSRQQGSGHGPKSSEATGQRKPFSLVIFLGVLSHGRYLINTRPPPPSHTVALGPGRYERTLSLRLSGGARHWFEDLP